MRYLPTGVAAGMFLPDAEDLHLKKVRFGAED